MLLIGGERRRLARRQRKAQTATDVLVSDDEVEAVADTRIDGTVVLLFGIHRLHGCSHLQRRLMNKPRAKASADAPISLDD